MLENFRGILQTQTTHSSRHPSLEKFQQFPPRKKNQNLHHMPIITVEKNQREKTEISFDPQNIGKFWEVRGSLNFSFKRKLLKLLLIQKIHWKTHLPIDMKIITIVFLFSVFSPISFLSIDRPAVLKVFNETLK
jgi:hypothetical protein